jgi:CPA1 family monovalent cation:H+ antiporter
LLNSIVFILMGLQFPSIVREMKIPVAQMIFIGGAISFVVIAVRFLWVLPVVSLERCLFRRGDRDYLSLNHLVVASWAGMRGVVSLAAALALPLVTSTGESFPNRHVILFLTFCIIFVTLILQGLSLPWLVRKLRVAQSGSDFESEFKARVALLGGLVAEIDTLIRKEGSPEYRETLERWRTYFQDRLEALEQRLELPSAAGRYAIDKDRDLLPKLIGHARRKLARMRREGNISEEVRRRIERDLDIEEQRVQRFLAPFRRE